LGWNFVMTNVMHKFLINLFIYFFLTCFGLSFSPSSEAGVQLRQWFKSAGYGVSAPVQSCNLLSMFGAAVSKQTLLSLKTCAQLWMSEKIQQILSTRSAQLYCAILVSRFSRWSVVFMKINLTSPTTSVVVGDLGYMEAKQMQKHTFGSWSRTVRSGRPWTGLWSFGLLISWLIFVEWVTLVKEMMVLSSCDM
jgi:hypothetical protein